MIKNKQHSTYTYMESCCDTSYSTAMNQLIDMEMVKIFMPYLHAGEKILWTAKPRGGLNINKEYLSTVPAGIFFIYVAITDNFDDVVIPLMVGIYTLFGQLIFELVRRHSCSYAITNQRIFIRSGIFSKDVQFLQINNLETLKLKVNNKNMGTITLTKPLQLPKFGKRNPLAAIIGYDDIRKLETIDKADEVYELIQRLQTKETVMPINHKS